MGNLALRVEGLSKLYRIAGRANSYRTLRDSLTDAMTAPFKRARSLIRGEAYGASGLQEEIWALKDVSFEVEHGEVVGIIGRNGAGKSTLLKILSRITDPTEGYAEVYGRVGSLLEVGTGFHPELTGRENIYLNGAILGMSRAEIDRKFDEIVDFAEIEKFIDTPVKHYSSGMGLRLGFAVAAHLEPEILIVDEVLAVGDAEFQKKCLGKMSDVAGEGRTVLFVSHNMAAVQTLCERSMLLASGRTVFSGPTPEVIGVYLESATNNRSNVVFGEETVRKGSGGARFTYARWVDADLQPINSLPMGGSATLEFGFEAYRRIKSPAFAVRLRTVFGEELVGWRSAVTHGEMPTTTRGGVVRLTIENLNLLPGIYGVKMGLSDGREMLDLIEEALELEITPYPVYPTGKLPDTKSARIYTPCSWQHDYE